MKKVFLFSAIVLVALGLSGCGYNTLTAEQQKVKGAWADVESSMQRRADLVPNLVKAAQMAAVQEQEVFGEVANARSRLLDAKSANPEGTGGDKSAAQKQAIIEANNSFGGTIGRLLSLTESYPQLKSSEAFMKVQDELAGTENRIGTARGDYNKAVTQYNTSRNQFPTVITAKIFGFQDEAFFKAEEGANKAPDIGSPDALRKK